MRDDLARDWEVRLADLLADVPDLEPELRELVARIGGRLGDASVTAPSLLAGQNVGVRADHGSVAAGVLRGSVASSASAESGSWESSAGPGISAPLMSGLVHADRGSVGVGQLFYQLPPAAGRALSLPPRLALLADREDLLGDLRARLVAAGGQQPQVLVLSGMGGVGKTSLAVEYAHRQQAMARIVWRLPAERPTVLAAEFGRLAMQIGAFGGPLDVRDPVASVHSALAVGPGRWLLIFDNVPDQESVERFLPPAGDGQVLITSQSPHWGSGQVLEVPTLSADASAAFLAARTGDPDEASARVLAAELGGLPLALEQAAAYIRATGGTLAAYIRLFRDRRSELLARSGPPGYGKTMATTWSLALGQLDEPGAALLRLIAYCAPEPVPVGMLLRPPPGTSARVPVGPAAALASLLNDPLAANDAIAGLRRFSMISIAGNDQLVQAHRLVLAKARDQVEADQEPSWRQAVAVLVEAAIPADPTAPARWPDFAVLLPHAEFAVGHDSDGMRRIASFLWASGNFAGSRDMRQRIAQTCARNLGESHPDTLKARALHANMTSEAGDAARARDLLEVLIPDIARVLGPESPDTLSARVNLARYRGRTESPAVARDELAILVPIHDRVFGKDTAGTLAVRTNLAGWTGLAGDPAAARDQYIPVVELHDQIRGPEHPQTLLIRRFLCEWIGKAGDAATAREESASLLTMAERVLGPEHPYTLAIGCCLAYWTDAAGDPVTAAEQFDAVLAVTERVLGPGHPQTQAVRRRSLDYYAYHDQL